MSNCTRKVGDVGEVKECVFSFRFWHTLLPKLSKVLPDTVPQPLPNDLGTVLSALWKKNIMCKCSWEVWQVTKLNKALLLDGGTVHRLSQFYLKTTWSWACSVILCVCNLDLDVLVQPLPCMADAMHGWNLKTFENIQMDQKDWIHLSEQQAQKLHP